MHWESQSDRRSGLVWWITVFLFTVTAFPNVQRPLSAWWCFMTHCENLNDPFKWVMRWINCLVWMKDQKKLHMLDYWYKNCYMCIKIHSRVCGYRKIMSSDHQGGVITQIYHQEVDYFPIKANNKWFISSFISNRNFPSYRLFFIKEWRIILLHLLSHLWKFHYIVAIISLSITGLFLFIKFWAVTMETSTIIKSVISSCINVRATVIEDKTFRPIRDQI